MALETADDLDTFFDPEEFGVAAVYRAPGGAAIPTVVIRDFGDEWGGSDRGRLVTATNHFLIRADDVTPVAKARLDLLDEAGAVTASFALQGDPTLMMPNGTIWRCGAVSA